MCSCAYVFNSLVGWLVVRVVGDNNCFCFGGVSCQFICPWFFKISFLDRGANHAMGSVNSVLKSNQDYMYDTTAQTFIRGIQMLEDTNWTKTLKGEQQHFQHRMAGDCRTLVTQLFRERRGYWESCRTLVTQIFIVLWIGCCMHCQYSYIYCILCLWLSLCLISYKLINFPKLVSRAWSCDVGLIWFCYIGWLASPS